MVSSAIRRVCTDSILLIVSSTPGEEFMKETALAANLTRTTDNTILPVIKKRTKKSNVRNPSR